MDKHKTIYWLLIIIGTLAVFASIFSFSRGEIFKNYFWGGLSGIALIIGASISKQERNKET